VKDVANISKMPMKLHKQLTYVFLQKMRTVVIYCEALTQFKF